MAQQPEQEQDLLPPQELAHVDQQAFSKGMVLSNGEVAFLLDVYRTVRMGSNSNFQLPATVKKTKDYVEKFGTGQNPETIRRIREICVRNGLKQFEYAVIVNMMPETAEEAIALVPSLNDLDKPEDQRRFQGDKLTELLGELAMFRQYQ